ncbi:hypothetical protein [Emticicia sp. BO119]|uniref:hypothetical protein n=1 Tax=Emticicia sp. BO119 TaxID=2757768 RepID=UPI0015F0FB09|nr:hypothetical protein [Emticicia sp. BO119]MBA4848817.1 hypothetical protein [Emticicia sp. BO119]
MSTEPIFFLKTAGFLQIILCIGSLAIPYLLDWKSELTKVSNLIKQIFWTYAGYILSFNLFFGLISFWGAEALLDKSFLTKSITIFIFMYWLVRIIIQFFYFDTKSAPKGLIYTLGEIGLVALFVFLTGVYGWVSYLNFH